jgi:hypothetical protein
MWLFFRERREDAAPSGAVPPQPAQQGVPTTNGSTSSLQGQRKRSLLDRLLPSSNKLPQAPPRPPRKQSFWSLGWSAEAPLPHGLGLPPAKQRQFPDGSSYDAGARGSCSSVASEVSPPSDASFLANERDSRLTEASIARMYAGAYGNMGEGERRDSKFERRHRFSMALERANMCVPTSLPSPCSERAHLAHKTHAMKVSPFDSRPVTRKHEVQEAHARGQDFHPHHSPAPAPALASRAESDDTRRRFLTRGPGQHGRDSPDPLSEIDAVYARIQGGDADGYDASPRQRRWSDAESEKSMPSGRGSPVHFSKARNAFTAIRSAVHRLTDPHRHSHNRRSTKLTSDD